MVPTLGRIVHCVDSMGEVNAAIITKVHSATCVNLHVFEQDGGVHFRTSVLWTSPGTGIPGWYWPPRLESC